MASYQTRPPELPTADESAASLHREGWSAGDARVGGAWTVTARGPGGRLHALGLTQRAVRGR